MTRNVVDIARSYLNPTPVPFRDHGRNRNGIDCAGLIILVAQDLGMDVTDIKGYARTSKGLELKRELDAQLIRKPRSQMADGDVLYFADERRRHVGIAATDRNGVRTVIHAHLVVGKVAETALADLKYARVQGVYGWPH